MIARQQSHCCTLHPVNPGPTPLLRITDSFLQRLKQADKATKRGDQDFCLRLQGVYALREVDVLLVLAQSLARLLERRQLTADSTSLQEEVGSKGNRTKFSHNRRVQTTLSQ